MDVTAQVLTTQLNTTEAQAAAASQPGSSHVLDAASAHAVWTPTWARNFQVIYF